MSIYTSYPTMNNHGNCAICLDPLPNKDSVAHANGGEKHPIHRDCAIAAALAGDILCPQCRVPTNALSLLTLKDKCVALADNAKYKCVLLGCDAAIGALVISFYMPGFLGLSMAIADELPLPVRIAVVFLWAVDCHFALTGSSGQSRSRLFSANMGGLVGLASSNIVSNIKLSPNIGAKTFVIATEALRLLAAGSAGSIIAGFYERDHL